MGIFGDSLLLAVILILFIVLFFDKQICDGLSTAKKSIMDIVGNILPTQVKDAQLIPDVSDTSNSGKERLNDPKITTMNPPDEVSSTLSALGYTDDVPWDEVIQASELDPSTFVNHMDFVKDVRRFSSGANFTSVTDDNTNLAFTNFRGLRRPEHVPIGPSARQQPDIDESVLQRNRPLRF